MLAVELQILVGGDAVGDDESACEPAEIRLFRRIRRKVRNAALRQLVASRRRGRSRSRRRRSPSTLEVPFSDCTIAASVVPCPDTFQATSALPASQSTCAAVAQQRPCRDARQRNVGREGWLGRRGIERDEAVAAAVVEAQFGQRHLGDLILDADGHLGAVDARAPVGDVGQRDARIDVGEAQRLDVDRLGAPAGRAACSPSPWGQAARAGPRSSSAPTAAEPIRGRRRQRRRGRHGGPVWPPAHPRRAATRQRLARRS